MEKKKTFCYSFIKNDIMFMFYFYDLCFMFMYYIMIIFTLYLHKTHYLKPV